MTSNLPYFIQEYLAFVSDVHLSRRYRSTIALLKNLQLYELHNKQILNSIDLKNTILNKVQHKIESASFALDVTQIQENDILGSSIRSSNTPAVEIVIGKYVYQNRNLKVVYIILKCWNSLVIVKKNPEGFTLEKEYKDVESFEIIKGSKFESKLAISFLDSSQNLVTNLQKSSSIQTNSKKSTSKKVEDAIRMKQSELLVHKTITKTDFSKLMNSNVFGLNFLRSHYFDEMRILSKCADAWLKVNADDKIVIGVPLVNNSCSRLTTLRNLRGLLQCSTRSDLNYAFAMYEQSTTLASLENIKCAFESESHSHSYDWKRCEEMILRPETFYVLMFEMNMKELIECNALDLLLFVSFNVIFTGKKFSQKCFLGKLFFRDIFANDAHKINFHQNQMHQDLLTVISTSHKIEMCLKFRQTNDDFKKYLCNAMQFFAVALPETPSETMQVDGCDDETEVKTQPEFFYNNNPNSLWHGTLIAIKEACDNSYVAKIFTKTQEKAIIFQRYLEIELRLKCGITEICKDQRSLDTEIIQLESLLRDECKLYLELLSRKHNESSEKVTLPNLHEEIILVELKIDLLLKQIKS